MLKINKTPSQGSCPKCANYQKQIVRPKNGLIRADDENVRRLLQYENQISKFKAEKEWLEAEDTLGTQARKGVKRLTDQSNTNLRAPDSSNIWNQKNGL